MCFFDGPGDSIPKHDEVHISTVFTWDISRALELQKAWQAVTDKPVKIGGPAFDDPRVGEFVPGMYVAKGITFTSDGCNNSCWFCEVPRREGKLKEIEKFHHGNIIQDNNFLQCSKEHRAKVYEMLKTQKQICFKGGLQVDLLTDWDIQQMSGLRIKELWLACDSKNRIDELKNACTRLHIAGFKQYKIYCYVLVGDSAIENEHRLKAVFNAGAMPFAQLFQPKGLEKKKYSPGWELFVRSWSRPAAYKTMMAYEAFIKEDKL
jgi:hypothetical protein